MVTAALSLQVSLSLSGFDSAGDASVGRIRKSAAKLYKLWRRCWMPVDPDVEPQEVVAGQTEFTDGRFEVYQASSHALPIAKR
jgi:hypothetical protein